MYIHYSIGTFKMKKGPITYPHAPDVTQNYSYMPYFKSLFATQAELGKPVKVGKTYTNAFFDDLAPVHYFFTYIAGFLSGGLYGGKGAQLNAQQKRQYKICADENGRCFFKNNSTAKIPSGYYRYIVSPKGGLYIFDADPSLFHNSIRGSQPVQCAGSLYLNNGFITRIDNSSGHYRPSRSQFMRTLGGLYAARFIDEGTKVFTLNVNSLFSTHHNHEGAIDELMTSGDIQIPQPWQATQTIHHKMKRRL